MKRTALLCAMLGPIACGGASDGFTAEEWETIESLANPEPPAPCPEGIGLPGDPDCEKLAELGQQLFFEKAFSGPIAVADDGANGGLGERGEPGQVACASCHEGVPSCDEVEGYEPPWFVDHRSRPNATSLGAAWVSRNAPSVVNAAYYDGLTWTGKFDTLAELVGGPLENEDFMNGDRLWLARVIYDKYRGPYEALFGRMDPLFETEDLYSERYRDLPEGDRDRRTADEVLRNAGLAIEAYERRLFSIDSPFDRWVRDRSSPYPEAAQRGLELFIGEAACVECHSGPMLTDGEFHNTGVAQVGTHVPPEDEGVGGRPGYEDLAGAFRVPSLRNVAMTAPYMHTGAEATLEDVIWWYNEGGDASGFAGTKEPLMVPLGLTEQDVSDLAAFLVTLTGEPVAEKWRCDTSLP